MKTVDLEGSQAEIEVRELEARLRVVPMNDAQLLRALREALEHKRGRLVSLRRRNDAQAATRPVRDGGHVGRQVRSPRRHA